MRKRLVILTLLFSLLLSACGNPISLPTEEEIVDVAQPEATESHIYDSSMEAQNKYAIFRNAVSFQEDEACFCGSGLFNRRLHYYDKDSGVSGILCSDPTCNHDGSHCGAYIRSGTAMFLYDGWRYWITDDYRDGVDYILWKGNIDGTDQVKVKMIDFDNIILPYQPQQFALHRGNLYFLGLSPTVQNTIAGNRVSLMVSTLDDSEEFTTLFDKIYETNVDAEVRFVGDDAYFLVQTWSNDAVNCADVSVYCISLLDRTTKVAFEKKNTSTTSGFWVTQEGELYLSKGMDILHVTNGAAEVIGTFREDEEKQIKIVDGIAVNTYDQYRGDECLRCLEIMDFSGNIIYNGMMFPNEIPEMDEDPNDLSLLFVGGDHEKLIFELGNMDDPDEEYTILLDLSNDLEPTILWHTEA